MNGYQQIPPIEAFCSRVDVYWINRPGGGAVDVLPDGCTDLIYRSGAAGGRLFVSALIEKPVPIPGAESDWFVGVRFKPAMARAFLDVDPISLRDREVAARAIDAGFGALEERLLDCTSPAAAFAVLKHAADARLAQREDAGPPRRVQEAIAALARGGAVHTVARAAGLSERSLHRELVRWGGLAPKSLARILRMQRCLAALRTGRTPLALLALRLGYADQAHMTRELKALAGVTPREVVREAAVRNLQDAA